MVRRTIREPPTKDYYSNNFRVKSFHIDGSGFSKIRFYTLLNKSKVIIKYDFSSLLLSRARTFYMAQTNYVPTSTS